MGILQQRATACVYNYSIIANPATLHHNWNHQFCIEKSIMHILRLLVA